MEATPKNVAQLEVELETFAANKQSLEEERDTLKALLQTLRAQWKLVEERQVRQGTLAQLEQDRARIDELGRAVELGKRAAQVLPVLDQAAAKLSAWQTYERKPVTCSKNLKVLRKSHRTRRTNSQERRSEPILFPRGDRAKGNFWEFDRF